jgi:hypothetical protein
MFELTCFLAIFDRNRMIGLLGPVIKPRDISRLTKLVLSGPSRTLCALVFTSARDVPAIRLILKDIRRFPESVCCCTPAPGPDRACTPTSVG